VSSYRIPFNRPALMGKECDYIAQAVAAGRISGDGEFTRQCYDFFQRELGTARALLTTSGTAALEMCALLLEIGPHDEVIVPSFSFVSANAFVLRGARPVFVDVRPDTLNLDERLLERSLSPRTRAVVAIHYAGVACEMDALLEIAAHRGVAVVEDNAHGLFGLYRGRPLGSLGALAAQSFHETKNVTCGEGGALLINDPRYVERAEIVWEKGTDRRRFFRGQVDKYTWVDVGSSFLPSEILAAFLWAQLEARAEIQARRQRIWEYYRDRLQDWAGQRQVRLPAVPGHCQQPYHMFYLVLPSLEWRQALIRRLAGRGILAVFHYLPLHLSAMGRRFGGRAGDCPITEEVSDRLLRLPFYNHLSEAEQAEVVECILGFDGP